VIELPEERGETDNKALFAREVARETGANEATLLEILRRGQGTQSTLLPVQMYELLKVPIVTGLREEGSKAYGMAVELDGQRTKAVGEEGCGRATFGTVNVCGYSLCLREASRFATQKAMGGGRRGRLHTERAALREEEAGAENPQPNLASSILTGDVGGERLANTVGWRCAPPPAKEDREAIFQSEEHARERIEWVRTFLTVRNSIYVYDMMEVAMRGGGEGHEGGQAGQKEEKRERPRDKKEKPKGQKEEKKEKPKGQKEEKKEKPRDRKEEKRALALGPPLLDALLALRKWTEEAPPTEDVAEELGKPYRFIPDAVWESLGGKRLTPGGLWNAMMQHGTERLWRRAVREGKWPEGLTEALGAADRANAVFWEERRRAEAARYGEALRDYARWRLFGNRTTLSPNEQRKVEQDALLLREMNESRRRPAWFALAEEIQRPGRTMEQRMETWGKLRPLLMEAPALDAKAGGDVMEWVKDREGNLVVCRHVFETYSLLEAGRSEAEVKRRIIERFALDESSPEEHCVACGQVLGHKGELGRLLTAALPVDSALREQIWQEAAPMVRGWVEFRDLVSERGKQEFTGKVVDALSPLVEELGRKIRKNRALSAENRALQQRLFTGIYAVVLLAKLIGDHPGEVIPRMPRHETERGEKGTKKEGVRLLEWCVEVIQAVYGNVMRRLIGQDTQLAGLGTDLLRRYVQDAKAQLQGRIVRTQIGKDSGESGDLEQSPLLEAAELAWMGTGLTAEEARRRALGQEEGESGKARKETGQEEGESGKEKRKGGGRGDGKGDGKGGNTSGFHWPPGVLERLDESHPGTAPSLYNPYRFEQGPRAKGERTEGLQYAVPPDDRYLGLLIGGAVSEKNREAIARKKYRIPEGAKLAEEMHTHEWELYQVDGRVYTGKEMQEAGFWKEHKKLEDRFCARCFQSYEGVLRGKGDDARSLLDEWYERQSFYNYMGNMCPKAPASGRGDESPYHPFEEGVCTRCGLSTEQVRTRDAAYYRKYERGEVWQRRKAEGRNPFSDAEAARGPARQDKEERKALATLLRQRPDVEHFTRESYRAIQVLEGKLPMEAYQNLIRNLGLTEGVTYGDLMEGQNPEETAGEREMRVGAQRLEGHLLKTLQTYSRVARGGTGETNRLALALQGRKLPEITVLGEDPLAWLDPLRAGGVGARERRDVLLWMLLDVLGQIGKVEGAPGQALLVFLLRQILAAEKGQSKRTPQERLIAESGAPEEATADAEPTEEPEDEKDGTNTFTYEGMDYEGQNESIAD